MLALPDASKATPVARVEVTGVRPTYVRSVKVTEPVGMRPDVPTLLTWAVKVSESPTTTTRWSGVDELIFTSTLLAAPCGKLTLPKANKVPPLRVYTVPSGPITDGTYGSPTPGVSATACESELV